MGSHVESRIITFLDECEHSDSDLEETAIKVATAVSDAHSDMELADSTTSTPTSAIDAIDPVVDVGAQIPVQPCTDLKPVARAIDRIKELLKKINDAISMVRKKVEKEVEDAINSLLHKLHLKGDVFKAFEQEVQKAEDAIVHLLWTPVQTVTDRVNKELAREQQNATSAVKSYIDLRAKISRALQPLDDLLRAYVAAAAKVGIRPQ